MSEEGKIFDPKNLMLKEEVAIIDGALNFREMRVSEIMTPVADVYMLSGEEKLSYNVL
jgi:CBS domain containing-hemolysin-like protein